MLPTVVGIISAIGNIFGGIFRTKEAKIEAIAAGVQGVVSVLQQADATDAQIAQAVATAVAAEANSESWLTRTWRPFIAASLWGIVLSAIVFGYTIPPEYREFVFECAKICLCGYIPLRTTEKIIQTVMNNKLIEKIVLQILGNK